MRTERLFSDYLRLTAWVLGAMLYASGAIAQSAPSLAEVARKEAERRKSHPGSGKVYTSKDLPASASKPAPAPAPAADIALPPDPVAAAAEAKAQQNTPADEKNEAWWRSRMAAAREEVRRNEVFAEALQTRINALSRDFVNRDNPVQRAQIGRERAEAVAELARVRDDIDRGRKQIADLEEEARKAGVPPGWLR